MQLSLKRSYRNYRCRRTLSESVDALVTDSALAVSMLILEERECVVKGTVMPKLGRIHAEKVIQLAPTQQHFGTILE
jgi:hypothetical protein